MAQSTPVSSNTQGTSDAATYGDVLIFLVAATVFALVLAHLVYLVTEEKGVYLAAVAAIPLTFVPRNLPATAGTIHVEGLRLEAELLMLAEPRELHATIPRPPLQGLIRFDWALQPEALRG